MSTSISSHPLQFGFRFKLLNIYVQGDFSKGQALKYISILSMYQSREAYEQPTLDRHASLFEMRLGCLERLIAPKWKRCDGSDSRGGGLSFNSTVTPVTLGIYLMNPRVLSLPHVVRKD